VGDLRRSVRSPGLRIVAAGRLPELAPSGIWPAAPRSQLRDSAGFSPASLIRAALFVMAWGGYSARRLRVTPAGVDARLGRHMAACLAMPEPTGRSTLNRRSSIRLPEDAALLLRSSPFWRSG
jgi:hypothetical protein